MREVSADVVELYGLMKQIAFDINPPQERQDADIVQKLDDIKNILSGDAGTNVVKRLSIIQNLLERVARYSQ